VAVALAGILLLPKSVHAQATIAGVIRDASAAVLPGVTVEASSPVLIEKTRTVVSDGTGQYRITDLKPGTYSVTFALTGFATVKREDVVVSGSGVITINADLRVGALEETLTVTGQSPIVDTQSVRREVVLNNETLSTLPATRGYGSALAAVPALNSGGVAGANASSAPTTPSTPRPTTRWRSCGTSPVAGVLTASWSAPATPRCCAKRSTPWPPMPPWRSSARLAR